MGMREYCAEYGQNPNAVPDIAGKYAGKNAVVCGDAACIWEDLETLGARKNAGGNRRGRVEMEGFDFLTVNKLIETFPGNIAHAYSNEPSLLMKFIAARRTEYRREFTTVTNTHSCNQGAKYRWPFGGHGTSGLGACLVALGLGYDKVIVCGMPLDNGPHNGEPPWRNCRFEVSEVASPKGGGIPSHWERAIRLAFDGRVTSMSGRTQEWLGSPRLQRITSMQVLG